MYLSETEVLLLLSDSGSALIIYLSLFLDDDESFVSILDAGFVIGLKLIFDPLCLGTSGCYSKNTHFLFHAHAAVEARAGSALVASAQTILSQPLYIGVFVSVFYAGFGIA